MPPGALFKLLIFRNIFKSEAEHFSVLHKFVILMKRNGNERNIHDVLKS